VAVLAGLNWLLVVGLVLICRAARIINLAPPTDPAVEVVAVRKAPGLAFTTLLRVSARIGR